MKTHTTQARSHPRIFLSFLLAFALCLSLATPAFAANRSDLCNAYTLTSTVARRLNLSADLDTLVERDVITSGERTFIRQYGSVTYAIAWRIVLPAYNIYPYPAEYYPDIAPVENCTGVYADARAAAINSTLASATVSPNSFMTVAELDELLRRVAVNDFVQPAIPTLTCPYVDPATIWTLETYTGRNSLLRAWDLLPPAWRDDFMAEGWDFCFYLPATYNYRDGNAYRVGGKTDYRFRLIYLCDSRPEATMHEFAHFAYWRAGWDADTFRSAFNREAERMYSYLGEYSQVSSTEYFAEFVSYWLTHPEDDYLLRDLAPRTMDLVRELAVEYPTLLR